MGAALSSETINLRAPSVKRALIDHAARLSGKTRTAFILDATCEKAQELLADQTSFLLSEKQMKAFNAALDAPLVNAEVIARLLAKRAPWEK